ncbi:MAG: sugar porter family MFS transporter [Isosphaeraceae bacterium]
MTTSRVPADQAPAIDLDAAASFNLGWIWTISLTAALGGLLFGYDWVVIGGAEPFYKVYFHLRSSAAEGWAMSSALPGCMLGALASAFLSDRFGRQRLLIAAAAHFAGSSVGTALAGTFNTFIANRLLGGVAIGLASNLSPLYIAEIAPARLRGTLVSVNQLTIVIGILLAQAVNMMIAQPVPADASAADILASWNGQFGWRWMFGATTVPALFFLAAMFIVPESPRWLAKQGLLARSHGVLARVGGPAYAGASLVEIRESLERDADRGDIRELAAPGIRGVLVLGIVLAVFQQWCGINVIFNYGVKIFASAGYTISGSLFSIVVTGAANLLATFVAIGTVDRLGRRFLMLAGSAGLAIIYMLIGLSYLAGSQGTHVLFLAVAAIACYACSLAPVTWVVLSEIFPNRVRGAALSLAVLALWVACFILTITFPILIEQLGFTGTFWLYAVICALGFVYIFHRLPETKRKSLEEIEAQLTLGPRH